MQSTLPATAGQRSLEQSGADLAARIHEANVVTACQFCNSTREPGTDVRIELPFRASIPKIGCIRLVALHGSGIHDVQPGQIARFSKRRLFIPSPQVDREGRTARILASPDSRPD